MTTVEMKDKSGCSLTLIEFEGRLFPKFPLDVLQNYRSMPIREDDIILCTYPKSGTHWLWEVMQMLLQQKAATIESYKSTQMIEFYSSEEMDKMTSPRVLNTHMLPDFLPKEVVEKGPKLVFLARNPKDVAVSLYNHHCKLVQYYNYSGTFSDWLELYLQGKVDYGSWFDYINSWEKAINGDLSNPIHILMYEDMKEDPVRETTQLAKFLGLTPDPELIKQIADKCDFAKMSVDKKPFQKTAQIMYRKGTVGDWKNYFTVAQSEMFDAFFAERMKDSKLKFKFTF